MFEKLSLDALEHYWWFIIALLAGLFSFIIFVQGGQVLLNTLAKNEEEKDLLVNALGRKWELSFTSLTVFGGALFAAFPLFYSVSFGGAYYAWMAILFCFVILAVSYEYRKKPNNFLGQKVYEAFLYINGSIGIILIGIALGTLFSGGYFVRDSFNAVHWTNKWYGLEAILNPFNVVLGLTLFFLARVNANLYFIKMIDEANIVKRAFKELKIDAALFLLFFLIMLALLLTMRGVSETANGFVIEPYKFLHNFLQEPILLGAFLIGVLLVVWALVVAIFKKNQNAIFYSGFGTVITVTSLFLLLGYNHTAIYPSLSDLQSSLSLHNASSSRYTLVVMSYVSLLVPFVLGYIYLVWKSMDKEKLTIQEIEADSHHY